LALAVVWGKDGSFGRRSVDCEAGHFVGAFGFGGARHDETDDGMFNRWSGRRLFRSVSSEGLECSVEFAVERCGSCAFLFIRGILPLDGKTLMPLDGCPYDDLKRFSASKK
jgi:hypothetical protein